MTCRHIPPQFVSSAQRRRCVRMLEDRERELLVLLERRPNDQPTRDALAKVRAALARNRDEEEVR